jgi:hypothetical protein
MWRKSFAGMVGRRYLCIYMYDKVAVPIRYFATGRVLKLNFNACKIVAELKIYEREASDKKYRSISLLHLVFEVALYLPH